MFWLLILNDIIIILSNLSSNQLNPVDTDYLSYFQIFGKMLPTLMSVG